MPRPSPSWNPTKPNRMVRIHPIRTGTVQFRTAQIRARSQGPFRLWRILSDREWTRELPIYCYLIEHPEGLFMVDTGASARVMEPGFFPRWHPYYRRAVKYRVAPEDEVGPQLRALGFDPEKVGCVIMTNMQVGHSGGLKYFNRARIIVSAQEWASCMGGVGRLSGYPNAHWPKWLTPRMVTFNAGQIGGLARSQPLTGDGAIYLVRTPGHTHGSISCVVEDGGLMFFFAGDASYLHSTMCEMVADGYAAHPRLQVNTLRNIRELAQSRPMVYLPTHDPDATRRLMELDTSVD